MTIKSAIYDIAKKQGYEGGEPRTTADAINALTDMLAGEDVEEGHTIKEAVKALEPYIGAGGGAPTTEMPTNYIELVDEFTGGYPFSDLYTFHLGIESLPTELNISANTPHVKVILVHAKSVSMNNGLNGGNVIAVLMPAIEEINDNGTFGGSTCDAYLGPNANSIAAYAFSKFTGTINCAFSAERGAELGAPWGASDSATVNYDVPVSSWPM